MRSTEKKGPRTLSLQRLKVKERHARWSRQTDAAREEGRPMNQLSIPVEIRPEEVARKATLGKAIEHCAEMGGYALDKQLQEELNADKAQFSRWLSGQEGIVWPKLEKLMDTCGNDVPVLWMLSRRGYDLSSLRKRETETERELRLAREEVAQLRHDKRVLTEALRGTTT